MTARGFSLGHHPTSSRTAAGVPPGRHATTASNVEASQDADLLVLAVKPQVTKGVCQELAGGWAGRSSLPLIVSIAAGNTLASLKEWFTLADGRSPHIIRVMPNTPALLGEGASNATAWRRCKRRDLTTAGAGDAAGPPSSSSGLREVSVNG